jgi:hypothetical protein
MNKLVGIVIINYNNLESTIECLNSLAKINYKNFFAVIVDNESKEEKINNLSNMFHYKMVILKNEKNIGFPAANNIGILKAIELKADYILFLNNDTIVEPDFLTHLVETATKENSIVGSLILNYYNQDIWYAGGRFNKFKGTGYHVYQVNSIISEIEYVTGCTLLAPSVAFKEVGLLDERLFLYGEDLDFCLRCKTKGYKILVNSKSIVYHKIGLSSRNNLGLRTYYSLRSFLIYRKKHSKGIYMIFSNIYLFYLIPRLILKAFFEKNIETVKKILCAIKDSKRILNNKWNRDTYEYREDC